MERKKKEKGEHRLFSVSTNLSPPAPRDWGKRDYQRLLLADCQLNRTLGQSHKTFYILPEPSYCGKSLFDAGEVFIFAMSFYSCLSDGGDVPAHSFSNK